MEEKGNQWRWLVLPETVRVAFTNLLTARKNAGDSRTKTSFCGRVFPLSVRQLRNIFYKTCQRAGLTSTDAFRGTTPSAGAHRHPHTARHTVVHELFAAGNSVALISKFMGHRTVQTTNYYYLRLSFDEIMAQPDGIRSMTIRFKIKLPWSI